MAVDAADVFDLDEEAYVFLISTIRWSQWILMQGLQLLLSWSLSIVFPSRSLLLFLISTDM